VVQPDTGGGGCIRRTGLCVSNETEINKENLISRLLFWEIKLVSMMCRYIHPRRYLRVHRGDFSIYFLILAMTSTAPRPARIPANGAGDFWVCCADGLEEAGVDGASPVGTAVGA